MTQPRSGRPDIPLAQADYPRARAAGLAFRSFSAATVTADELAFLNRLYASTRAGELAVLPWSAAEKQAFLDMQFQAQHAHYMQTYPDAAWLILRRGPDGPAGDARSGETSVGRLYLERWPSEIRIIDIALMPAARRAGLGSALLGDILELAAGEGRAVGIHVERTNPAMSLYRRFGFTLSEDKGIYHLLHWREGQGRERQGRGEQGEGAAG